jgi:hypothetical protein
MANNPMQTLASMLGMVKTIDDMTGTAVKQGRPDPKSIERIAAMHEGFNQLDHLATLKAKGFGGRGIDTGPIAKRYPQTLSAFMAGLTGVPEKEQGDRKKLEAATLWFLNPIRKEVTGAQAAIEELRKFLMPMIPTMGDNDANWKAAAMEAASQLANKYNTFTNTLESAGYKIPARVQPDDYLQRIEKTLYGGDNNAANARKLQRARY